jgi:hypothetical protein
LPQQQFGKSGVIARGVAIRADGWQRHTFAHRAAFMRVGRRTPGRVIGDSKETICLVDEHRHAIHNGIASLAGGADERMCVVDELRATGWTTQQCANVVY